MPQSDTDSTRDTTKRCNGEQVIYHNSHPHHETGKLRGRVGVGDHRGQKPEKKSIINSPPQSASSFFKLKCTIQESGGKLLAGLVGCLLSSDGRAKLSKSEQWVQTRCGHPDLDTEAHTFLAHMLQHFICVLCAQTLQMFSECRQPLSHPERLQRFSIISTFHSRHHCILIRTHCRSMSEHPSGRLDHSPPRTPSVPAVAALQAVFAGEARHGGGTEVRKL